MNFFLLRHPRHALSTCIPYVLHVDVNLQNAYPTLCLRLKPPILLVVRMPAHSCRGMLCGLSTAQRPEHPTRRDKACAQAQSPMRSEPNHKPAAQSAARPQPAAIMPAPSIRAAAAVPRAGGRQPRRADAGNSAKQRERGYTVAPAAPRRAHMRARHAVPALAHRPQHSLPP
jgi:hypothetical protein